MNTSLESFACGVLAGAIIASVLSYLLLRPVLGESGEPCVPEVKPQAVHAVWVEPGPQALEPLEPLSFTF